MGVPHSLLRLSMTTLKIAKGNNQFLTYYYITTWKVSIFMQKKYMIPTTSLFTSSNYYKLIIVHTKKTDRVHHISLHSEVI